MKIYLFVLFNLFYSVVYSQIQQDILISEIGMDPAVEADEFGIGHILWAEFLAIKYSALDTNGNFLISAINVSESHGRRNPSLSIMDTLVASAWGQQSVLYEWHIDGQLFTTSGAFIGNSIRFEDWGGGYGTPDVAWLNDSLYVVVWSGEELQTPPSGSGVFGQFVSSSNSLIGSNFLITDHGFANITHSNAHVVATADNNKFLVIWVDNYLDDFKVWGRYFNYNGLPLDDSFLISDSLSPNRILDFDSAKDNQGNIVIVWLDNDLSQGGFIKWRWIDPQGNFLGESEIITPENSVVFFSEVSISIDFNGDIILIYEDKRSGSVEIYGQRFNPDRTILGTEFKISSRTTNFAQLFTDVALQNGKIYTVWSEFGNSFEGVWASIFNYDIYVSSSRLEFGDVEVNTISDTLKLIVSNYGEDELIITDIPEKVGTFTRTSTHSFPLTLQSLDSVAVEIIFAPTIAGDYDEILPISSSDPNFPEIHLISHSYEMLEAFTDIFYASTGFVNIGEILVVSRETGEGTTLGPSLFRDVKSLTVNPANNIIYGLVSDRTGSEVVRVNAGKGDSYTLFNLDISSLTGIDFDTTGKLYVCKETGEIYRIDLTDGNHTYISTATIPLNALAFDPITNQLWAAKRITFGPGKDSIFTVDISTGLATLVGVTGFGDLTNDLAFDENDKLYGVTGTTFQTGKLFEINTTNGSGTLIGEIGFNNVLGLTFSIDGLINSIEGDDSIIPDKYSLKQNFPNPFNPTTTISYSIKEPGMVVLNVYDILGNEVATLVNEEKAAGRYTLRFDASTLASGLYFYRLQSGSFVQTRKMILLK